VAQFLRCGNQLLPLDFVSEIVRIEAKKKG